MEAVSAGRKVEHRAVDTVVQGERRPSVLNVLHDTEHYSQHKGQYQS